MTAPPGLPAPILRGALRGGRWLLGSHGKTLRVLLDTYEPNQTALFRELIRPGDSVLDIGAHVGYYTLLASRLVGPAGRVVAFEPAPENLRFLRSHVRVNRCANVTVVEAAISNRPGSARFDTGAGSGRGRLAEEADSGGVEVPVIRLDEFLAEHDLCPNFVKIDVEGEEVRLLWGARRMLREHRPVLLLSLHGSGRRDRCCGLLEEAGYSWEVVGGNEGELLCRPPGGTARGESR